MEKNKLLQIQADVTKKEVLRDQMLYNISTNTLSMQEKEAAKTLIKRLEISINQMSKILK